MNRISTFVYSTVVRVVHLFQSPLSDAIILSNDSIENAPLERNLHKLHGTSSWPRSSWILVDGVDGGHCRKAHGRGTRIKSGRVGIGRIDSGDKYARTPVDWRKRGWMGGERGEKEKAIH